MTTDKLLENLRRERSELDNAIRLIERATNRASGAKKAAEIVKAVANDKKELFVGKSKKQDKKKKHWTQTPAGRKRMSEIQKKSWAGRIDIPLHGIKR